MNSVRKTTASPGAPLSEHQTTSSTSLKSQERQKVLMIILGDDQSQEFKNFCLQIYNQSIYLSHKNLARIIMCRSYEETKNIQKDFSLDFYILSSQKTIQQLQNPHKLKQNWVVYDSGAIGSKKKILDMPRVVYYTKQLQSLRSKLQSRKFISKETLVNEKYRRSFEQNKKKVRAFVTTPIQAYIQESIQPNSNNLIQTERVSSIIEALKSQISNKFTPKQYNLYQEKIKIDFNLSPRDKQEYRSKASFENDYLQENMPQQKQRQKATHKQQNFSSKNYSNVPLGQGSNRVIDLKEYQKFNQNGLIVYRKKAPQMFYLRPVTQNSKCDIQKNPLQDQIEKNNDYSTQPRSNFNPQNATYDQKIFHNLSDNLNQKSGKHYKTCGSDYCNLQSKPGELISKHSKQNKIQVQKKDFYSQHDSKFPQRTSEQMKERLDYISSYRNQDDYQVQKMKKNVFRNHQHHNNMNPRPKQKLQRPILLSQQRAKHIIFLRKAQSNKKTNSLSSRYVGSDSSDKNKNSRISDAYKQKKQPLSNVQKLQQTELQKSTLKPQRSLQNRKWRPLLSSAQKRKKLLQRDNQPSGHSYDYKINAPSQISQKAKQQSSTVQSYIQGKSPTNKQNPLNHQVPSIISKSGSLINRQDLSILYLVDHLMTPSILDSLQSFMTSTDSLYKFKNLAQLNNQIIQSEEVYDLVFVFREQVISLQDIESFYGINASCFFVQINPHVSQFKMLHNRLVVKNMDEFVHQFNALATKIMQRK